MLSRSLSGSGAESVAATVGGIELHDFRRLDDEQAIEVGGIAVEFEGTSFVFRRSLAAPDRARR